MNSEQLQVCLALHRANLAMVQRFDRSLGAYYGLGFNDFVLLYHLTSAPEGRMKRVDLAEKLGMSISGVTRALIPLEKIGIVTRQSNPRDARIAYAVITEAGATHFANALATAKEVAVDALPPMETNELYDLQGTLAAIIGR